MDNTNQTASSLLFSGASNRINRNSLEQKVKDMYREVALHPEMTYHFEMGRKLAERLGYSEKTLNQIPKSSIDSFAGVGHFFDLAKLQKGEMVLDLGSGSGMDVFYAALQVGDEGEVIGIDMTKAQLDKAERLAAMKNINNTYFLKDYVETPPIRSDSIDAVISNGVINLSSDKNKVFENAVRVLKPGGRLAIADIVSNEILPENITCDVNLWASCIGGAAYKESYLLMIENAGLKIEKVKTNPYAFISNSAKGATKDYGIESISILAVKPK